MNAKDLAAVSAAGLIAVAVVAEGRQNSREEWRQPAVGQIEISVAAGVFVSEVGVGPAVQHLRFVAPPAQRFVLPPVAFTSLGPVVQPSS